MEMFRRKMSDRRRCAVWQTSLPPQAQPMPRSAGAGRPWPAVIASLPGSLWAKASAGLSHHGR